MDMLMPGPDGSFRIHLTDAHLDRPTSELTIARLDGELAVLAFYAGQGDVREPIAQVAMGADTWALFVQQVIEFTRDNMPQALPPGT